MPICIIFGAGTDLPEQIQLPDGDKYIVAADGGLNTLNRLGIKPDHMIGDLDSFTDAPPAEHFTKLPHIKDTTDTFEAVRLGQAEGCTEFHIYGGTGGRPDHTIANIQLAAMLSETGQIAFIHGHNYIITAITNGSLKLPSKKSGYVSVFAHSNSCIGVNINGLLYELDDAVLRNSFALGVSNEFAGKQAEISVKQGTLCIYYEI